MDQSQIIPKPESQNTVDMGESNESSEIVKSLKSTKINLEDEEKTPLFPIEGFPEFIQHFIITMSNIYRTPRDYWAGSVITATALAIGNKMELTGKYRNNPILWVMFIGDVSNGKTEPLDKCLSYFRKHDSEKIKQYNQQLIEFNIDSKAPKQERIGLEPPECFQFLLNDFTPEAMAEAHRVNERGLLIYRDELKGWIDDFGRYSKSGEQSNMLTSWSQKGITYNRKTGRTLNIEKPCLLVAGGIHRELLHTLANENRAENGFLARMIAVFPDNTQKQPYNNSIPEIGLLNAWDQFVKSLTEIRDPKELILPEQTSMLYENWYNENVKKINAEPTAYLKGVFGKLDIICLRIAVVIRGMNYQLEGITTPEILPREMKAAIELTEYFRTTALKVYRQIYGETKFGKYSKEDIAVWLSKNTELTKQQIAYEVLNSSRSQLDRLISKNQK